MTREEFIKQRCEIDKITEEEFEKRYRVVKCNCGQPYCKGYRCLDLDGLLKENQSLKKQLEEKNNSQIFIDTQDMEERYAEELYQDFLKEENKQLKDNWDKLKEWLKEYEEGTYGLGSYETGLSDGLGDVIKKMRELQGSDSNE